MPRTPTRHLDARRLGHARGRGATVNPPNRHEDIRLLVLDQHRETIRDDIEAGVQITTEATEAHEETMRSFLNRVDSPDLPFQWTINPYRGCEHGCAYCYARPTHENLGFSCGVDFESRIVVRRDGPKLLRRELGKFSWTGEPIVMSGATDAYQPLERKLRITRQCVELIASCGQPLSIVTKNRLVLRDLPLLQRLAKVDACHVAVSITTLDHALARRLEPRASSPRDRLETVRALKDAGIPVRVMMAPIIPGLTDHEIPAVLRAAAEAGAHDARWVMLRLPWQVETIFEEWMKRWYPDRVTRVLGRLRSIFGGRTYDGRFGNRMRGGGIWSDQIGTTFNTFSRRYGLERQLPPLSSASFHRPSPEGQLELFR